VLVELTHEDLRYCDDPKDEYHAIKAAGDRRLLAALEAGWQ
jgi:hypothetical protein